MRSSAAARRVGSYIVARGLQRRALLTVAYGHSKDEHRERETGYYGSSVLLAFSAVAAAAGVVVYAQSTASSECAAGADGPSTGETEESDWQRKRRAAEANFKIISGNANRQLALDIANSLGVQLGKVNVSQFADGEVKVTIQESVRDKNVYIIQSTCPPVNQTLMELLLAISCARRASAGLITAVIPYYGYARQDRKMTARVPISAADVARLIEAMGADRIIAVDLHAGQIQGFFGPEVPVDNVDGGAVGAAYFAQKELLNPIVISPDAPGVYRAKRFKETLMQRHDVDSGMAMLVTERKEAPDEGNPILTMNLVGSVEGCDVIIVADMVATAATLCRAADALKEGGARRVFCFASHGVLTGQAPMMIANSALEELVVLDTVPLSDAAKATGKITQLSVSPILARAIYNIQFSKSLSTLFREG